MKTPRETREILDRLETQHPGADTELHYRTPYELLVATILSAQSTDARVNLVTPALFKRYPNAAALAKATTRKLEPQIHSTGFYRAKSKALLGMAQALVADARRRGAGQHGRAGRVARRRPQDRERRARTRARRAGAAGRSPRAAGREPHRHRGVRRPCRRRAAAGRRAAEGTLDADIGHADSSRPAHLPSQTALRRLRGPRRV